jgi:hypothetical protein
VKWKLPTQRLGTVPAGNIAAGKKLRRWAEAPNRREVIVKDETRSRQEVSANFSNAAPRRTMKQALDSTYYMRYYYLVSC